MSTDQQDEAWIPRSGPMPRPESVEQAAKTLKTESFPAPEYTDEVEFRSEEFTSICPKSGQPDFSTIVINYQPDELCIESKSLKFYLWAFRDYGGFCEGITQKIAVDIMEAIQPCQVTVIIKQNVRGGLELDARTTLTKEEYYHE
ncbi:MAG: preQ(1) synthase [Bacillota bacterium]